ncbi:HD domain-containing protein [Clavibacter nebraskensis]|uniref:HD domain-containing protein n=1 Tax=Clavibacter nebraskensis TaxID=31963 RepID=UPI003F4B8D8A
MDRDRLVNLARDIATRAHAGQVDKAGLPYIRHPTAVAARLLVLYPDAPAAAEAAALLHDVLEDTDVTADELLEAGIPRDAVDDVIAVTKVPGESMEAYFARVRARLWARRIKEADVEENTDPERLALLEPDTRTRLEGKYRRSRALLAVQDA